MYGWPVKDLLIENNKKGLSIPLNRCLPTIDKNLNYNCLVKAKEYFNSIIKDNRLNTVIIGLTWHSINLVDENNYSYSTSEERNKSLIFLIEKLEANNKNVFLIGPILTPNYNLASTVSRNLVYGKKIDYKLFEPINKFNELYYEDISFFKNKLKENFLLPHEYFCDKANCYFADKLGSNFSDKNHLSQYGALKLKELFSIAFK